MATRKLTTIPDCAPTSIGENVSIEVRNGSAIITIDLTRRGSISASGKSHTVASTRGNAKVPGTPVSLGINAYVKRDA